MLHGDGKVTASQVKGRRGETRKNANGEDVPVRYDPDAADHLEGGSSEPTYGTKWLTVSARSDEGRVVIDTRYVPFGGEGGEAGVAVSAFARIAPKAPGVLGVIWDGALRGVHIDRIMRELGWLTIAPVAAKSRDVRRGGKGGLRVPKSREIEVKTVERRPGEVVPVPLYAVDGRLGLGELNDRGETAFVPLERIRTQRMADKRGFRFYNQYRMPQGYTTREITVRLHNSPKDGKLNRAENLRAIPYGDPDRRELYLRRKDAESLNDVLERSLYPKKAHSIGRWRQESDLLGFGLLMNAQTLAQALARERIERAAA